MELVKQRVIGSSTPEVLRNPAEFKALLVSNAPRDISYSDVDPSDWLAKERNIALRIDNDLALFEHRGDDLFEGHTFFASRGRDALRNGHAILAEARRLGAKQIYGETPVHYRAVHWFNRQLGFKPVRNVTRPWGECVFYVLNTGTSEA